MQYIISAKESIQLKKQGHDVTAGQIVDADKMPEWIRKRAKNVTGSKATATNPAHEMVTRKFGNNSPAAKQTWINSEMRRCNTW